MVFIFLGLFYLVIFVIVELKIIEFSFFNFKSLENDGIINILNVIDVFSGRNVFFFFKEKNVLSVGWVIYEEKV